MSLFPHGLLPGAPADVNVRGGASEPVGHSARLMEEYRRTLELSHRLNPGPVSASASMPSRCPGIRSRHRVKNTLTYLGKDICSNNRAARIFGGIVSVELLKLN